MRFISLIFAALILISTPAQAQSDGYIAQLLSLPADHTILKLSAVENMDVKQDLLTAQLSFKAQGNDPVALQDDVNTAIQKALDTANKFKQVKTRTLNYSIYEFYPDPEQRKIKQWVAEQSIALKSTTTKDVLKLSGELQSQGLLLQGLSFSISPNKHDEVTDSLLESAIQKLQAKANRAAKAAGKSTAEILDIHVNDQSSQPYMHQDTMYRSRGMSMAKAEMSAPIAQAGESRISISVNGHALLKP